MHCIASHRERIPCTVLAYHIVTSAWTEVTEGDVSIKRPRTKSLTAIVRPTSTEIRQCQHHQYSDLLSHSTPRRHTSNHDAAVSALRGLDANRSISAETSSLVLLMVRRHSLAS